MGHTKRFRPVRDRYRCWCGQTFTDITRARHNLAHARKLGLVVHMRPHGIYWVPRGAALCGARTAGRKERVYLRTFRPEGSNCPACLAAERKYKRAAPKRAAAARAASLVHVAAPGAAQSRRLYALFDAADELLGAMRDGAFVDDGRVFREYLAARRALERCVEAVRGGDRRHVP